MMKKKWYILMAVAAMAFSNVTAQNVITVQDEDGETEDIEMPEGMTVEADSVLQDFDNKTRLSERNDVLVNDLPYDDKVLVDRLAHIPTTIEMPLNNITRKFIDQYCNRMRQSVSVMLGSSNFYMPFFEEALEHYGLPLELKYLPVIESALRPTAQSHAGAVGLWQFMLATGKNYGLEVNTLVDERRDPVKSSYAAAHYPATRDSQSPLTTAGKTPSLRPCSEPVGLKMPTTGPSITSCHAKPVAMCPLSSPQPTS